MHLTLISSFLNLADSAASVSDAMDTGNGDENSLPTTEPSSATAEEEEEDRKPAVWYKFNKGFTNAVRRTVKMREILF